MKEVVYDIEEFGQLVDRSERIHCDVHIEYPRRVEPSARVKHILEGISKADTILRYEKIRRITFDEVCKHADELRKSGQRQNTNAYDDLRDLIKKDVDEWKKECKEKFNATLGRYDEHED